MYSFHYPITIDKLTSLYKDDIECNSEIYQFFESVFNDDEKILNHRFYVEENKLGWGDRAFHGMWKVIIESMPPSFTFLEIGVFKGQILSLISLLSKIQNKESMIFGISPLSNIGDQYWVCPKSDFKQDIKNLFEKFELDYNVLFLYEGLSTEQNSINWANENGKFNVVYIDGGHDYSTVKSDIINFKELVNINGYLIMDDASCFLNMPTEINNGLIDVAEATKDFLENDFRFVNIFNVGHNRVFKRMI